MPNAKPYSPLNIHSTRVEYLSMDSANKTSAGSNFFVGEGVKFQDQRFQNTIAGKLISHGIIKLIIISTS